MMDDRRAAQHWSQSITIAPWWLFAPSVISPSSSIMSESWSSKKLTGVFFPFSLCSILFDATEENFGCYDWQLESHDWPLSSALLVIGWAVVWAGTWSHGSAFQFPLRQNTGHVTQFPTMHCKGMCATSGQKPSNIDHLHHTGKEKNGGYHCVVYVFHTYRKHVAAT